LRCRRSDRRITPWAGAGGARLGKAQHDGRRTSVLDPGDKDLEDVMTLFSMIEIASRDAYPALVAGLETQFECTENDAVAAHFVDAEAADFHWQSRIDERHLGAFESDFDEDPALDRIAIVGRLRGAWFTAICIVDGDGDVHWMQHLQQIVTRDAALAACILSR
jgi:hypothetical protein